MDIIEADTLTLPATASQWLETLPGPVAIEIQGKDSSRWRAVSTLIHGNEPSGFFAAFHFLKSGIKPACNLTLLVSSVRAARQAPIFSNRHIRGEFDLNRRFGISDCHDGVTEVANDISNYLTKRKPELLVDLHNTSGRGPAFSVATSDTQEKRQLAAIFADAMVVTRLVVGSLMEQDFGCPCVTIECGGANDESSHKLAFEGLEKFALMEQLEEQPSAQLAIYYQPTRIETCSGISLGYTDSSTCTNHPNLSQAQQGELDITLADDIEKYNYGILTSGTAIALLRRKLEDSLCAYTDDGRNIINELFYCENNRLIAKQDLKVFMATRRADIALSDCLFYAIRA